MTLGTMPPQLASQNVLLSTTPGFTCARTQYPLNSIAKNQHDCRPCCEQSSACFQDLYGNNYSKHTDALASSHLFADVMKRHVLAQTPPRGANSRFGPPGNSEVWCPRLGYRVDWNSVGVSDCGACNVSQ